MPASAALRQPLTPTTDSFAAPGSQVPNIGSFVRLRGRRWPVEGEREVGEQLTALRLACIDDDAQSETTDVVWRAEIDPTILADEGWQAVARDGTDDPVVFAAYLKALCWGTAAGPRHLRPGTADDGLASNLSIRPRVDLHHLRSYGCFAPMAVVPGRTAAARKQTFGEMWQ
jgi:hypothetical protein